MNKSLIKKVQISSSGKINYNLRPAKNIERKMFCEALQKLIHFDNLDKYRYIGFGAIYFRDFSLFHRILGIKDMISIEHDEIWEKRFRFNKPFDCVDIKFGNSNEILPSHEIWDLKTIIWLDYDFKIGETALADISCFCANAKPGSVIILTVDVKPTEDNAKTRYNTLTDDVGRENMPSDSEPNHLLKDWGEAEICYKIIKNKIEQQLTHRNGVLEGKEKIRYKQLFNFHYEDGAKMLTVGGLIYKRNQSKTVNKCDFDHLSFIRSREKPYEIKVPKLTYREICHLNQFLPDKRHTVDGTLIPDDDTEKYKDIYKYYPIFAETEM